LVAELCGERAGEGSAEVRAFLLGDEALEALSAANTVQQYHRPQL